MKEGLSREKLSHLHEALDRELENVEIGALASSTFSNRSKDRLRQDSKPSTTSASELEQLQKKLNYLEKKMESIKLDDEQVSSHSLISETEVAAYRPMSGTGERPNKLQFERSVKKEVEFPIGSTGKRSDADRKQSNLKYQQLVEEHQETPLKRKYEAPAGGHSSAGKKPSSRKKPQQLNELERQIRKAEQNLNMSRKSISQQSVKSMGKRNFSLQKGTATRQPHCQKSAKIDQLEKQLAKCKQDNRKLKSRVKLLELTEADFNKLKISFEKSEHIRKQQKLLLDGYKQKLQKEKGLRKQN